MKINPLTPAIDFTNRIREKQEGEGGTGSGGQYQQQQQQSKQDETPIEVTDEKVGAAIDSFALEAASQQNGLSAASIGSGPGLKVVLKDGTGAVIRQFTGEEFLRLRETATQDPKARGKLLDQKL